MNLRLPGPEPGALTGLSHAPKLNISLTYNFEESPEPPTLPTFVSGCSYSRLWRDKLSEPPPNLNTNFLIQLNTRKSRKPCEPPTLPTFVSGCSNSRLWRDKLPVPRPENVEKSVPLAILTDFQRAKIDDFSTKIYVRFCKLNMSS